MALSATHEELMKVAVPVTDTLRERLATHFDGALHSTIPTKLLFEVLDAATQLERERGLLSQQLAEHEEFRPTHAHKEGALYQVLFHGARGRYSTFTKWEDGVVYRDDQGDVYWRSLGYFQQRFTALFS